MELEGKSAIVTGSGNGIGKAIALTFAKAGALVACVDIDEAAAKDTAQEIQTVSGLKTIAVKADVTKPEDVQNMVKTTVNAFGRLDILVNNAGIRLIGSVTDTTEEQWQDTMQINLSGVFRCCKYVVPEMVKHGKGKIVNIASTFGMLGFPDRVAYCSSKSGVIGLTRALAWELAPQNINVNAISPGFILTRLTIPYENDPKMIKFVQDSTALGRWGHGEDVAETATFFSSDRADFITGVIIPVDGGYTAGKKQ